MDRDTLLGLVVNNPDLVGADPTLYDKINKISDAALWDRVNKLGMMTGFERKFASSMGDKIVAYHQYHRAITVTDKQLAVIDRIYDKVRHHVVL